MVLSINTCGDLLIEFNANHLSETPTMRRPNATSLVCSVILYVQINTLNLISEKTSRSTLRKLNVYTYTYTYTNKHTHKAIDLLLNYSQFLIEKIFQIINKYIRSSDIKFFFITTYSYIYNVLVNFFSRNFC